MKRPTPLATWTGWTDVQRWTSTVRVLPKPPCDAHGHMHISRSDDLAEMMTERGISVAPSPRLQFEKRWSRFARPVDGSRRVDETYVKIAVANVHTSIAPRMPRFTIAGAELLHRIRKNQFALSRLRVRGK